MSGKADHIRILEDLRPRQREILEMIAQGTSTKAMALALAVSPKTVEYHRTELMKATHLFTVAELTRLAERLGLADINP